MKVHSKKCLHKKREKAHISNLMVYLKALEEGEIMPKRSRWQAIIKLRAEIKEIETNKNRNEQKI